MIVHECKSECDASWECEFSVRERRSFARVCTTFMGIVSMNGNENDKHDFFDNLNNLLAASYVTNDALCSGWLFPVVALSVYLSMASKLMRFESENASLNIKIK